MKYQVHKLEVRHRDMHEQLEQFLSRLKGEVVAVIPEVVPIFMMYGSKVSHLLVVEKLRE